jgi:hypothetical protein
MKPPLLPRHHRDIKRVAQFARAKVAFPTRASKGRRASSLDISWAAEQQKGERHLEAGARSF